MIPRLKPFLGWEELLAVFQKRKNAVERFERAFGEQFHVKYAIAFPYGRSALWAFLRTKGFEDAEVVQPAYTCSVVAHATVISGNIPVFVDCALSDYNMDLSQFEQAITPNTRVVIPTHVFGYPMDVTSVQRIVSKAEKKFGHKIWIIQDCAHSFDAHYEGTSVINAGDGALFGLGISKQITSIFGGMFTTNDEHLAQQIRDFRDQNFLSKGWIKSLKRYLYLLAVYPAFSPLFFGLVYWLQKKTPFLDRLTKAYHLDEKIHMPPDFQDKMTNIEALIGLEQVKKYSKIVEHRKKIADIFFDQLERKGDFDFPPRVNGATYSHFAIRTNMRDEMLSLFAKQGIELGQLIEYSMPHHPAYIEYCKGQVFPNSLLCSQSMINLPNHYSVNVKDGEKIVKAFNNV